MFFFFSHFVYISLIRFGLWVRVRNAFRSTANKLKPVPVDFCLVVCFFFHPSPLNVTSLDYGCCSDSGTLVALFSHQNRSKFTVKHFCQCANRLQNYLNYFNYLILTRTQHLAAIYFWLWVSLSATNDYFTSFFCSTRCNYLQSRMRSKTHRCIKKNCCYNTRLHREPGARPLTAGKFSASDPFIGIFWIKPAPLTDARVFVCVCRHFFPCHFYHQLLILWFECNHVEMNKQYNHCAWFHYRQTNKNSNNRNLLSFVSKGMRLIDAWAHFYIGTNKKEDVQIEVIRVCLCADDYCARAHSLNRHHNNRVKYHFIDKLRILIVGWVHDSWRVCVQMRYFCNISCSFFPLLSTVSWWMLPSC